MNDLIYVAKLGKTNGLLGFLKLHNKSDFEEQFKSKAKFYNKNGKEFVIKQYDKNNSLVQFVGFEDINSAKSLVNMELFSTIEQTRKSFKLKKDEYFYFDIIGKDVFENNELLGKVVDILEQGASYLFELKTSDELVSKNYSKTFFIPYHDNFIVSIQDFIEVKNSKAILENS